MINRYFKQVLSSFVVLFASIYIASAQTHYYIIPPQTYTQRYDYNINYPFIYQYQEREGIINTNEFKISELITLKEYKTFLNETKDQVTEEEYTKLLPLSSCFTKEVYDRYLHTDEFDEYPVIAVTGYAIFWFCKWKTIHENEPGSLKYFYRLPGKYEWKSAYYFLNKLDAPHDFGKYYTDWTLNSYDEYQYNYTHDVIPVRIKEEIIPNEDDPLVLKRRRILGTSYLNRQPYWNENGFYQFFENSSPYLSFRCVKDENLWIIETSKTKFNKDTPNDSISTYLKINEFIQYWGLEDLIYNSTNEQEEIEPVEEVNEKSSDIKKITDGLTWSFYPYKVDKTSDVSTNPIIPKYTGEYCGGQKYGDWYYFTKNGKLKKHCYYTKEGNKLTIDPPVEYPNVPEVDDIIAKGFYAYSSKLKDEQKDENKVLNNKNTSYEIKDGRLNGYFVYAKDNIQVAGRYNNNLKTGIWALWSSNKLIMVRDYNMEYEYKTIYSANPQNPLTLLLDYPYYKLNRNDDGYFEYYNLPEKDVLWSKTINRSLKPDQNPLLFQDHSLMDIILDGATKGDFPVFKIDEYHDFGDSMTVAEVLDCFNPEQQEISSYITKEIFFFDGERVIMECRALGFCPVVIDKNTGKEKELFWVYLPVVRKSFVQIPVQKDIAPSHIKNLDDLFFFRCYGGSIIGESNVYNNRRLSDYVTGKEVEEEVQRIENQLMDFEYETWGYFMGIKKPSIY